VCPPASSACQEGIKTIGRSSNRNVISCLTISSGPARSWRQLSNYYWTATLSSGAGCRHPTVHASISIWMAPGHLHGDSLRPPSGIHYWMRARRRFGCLGERDRTIVAQVPDLSLWVPRSSALLHHRRDPPRQHATDVREDLAGASRTPMTAALTASSRRSGWLRARARRTFALLAGRSALRSAPTSIEKRSAFSLDDFSASSDRLSPLGAKHRHRGPPAAR
jgi:hypothetical protein